MHPEPRAIVEWVGLGAANPVSEPRQGPQPGEGGLGCAARLFARRFARPWPGESWQGGRRRYRPVPFPCVRGRTRTGRLATRRRQYGNQAHVFGRPHGTFWGDRLKWPESCRRAGSVRRSHRGAQRAPSRTPLTSGRDKTRARQVRTGPPRAGRQAGLPRRAA